MDSAPIHIKIKLNLSEKTARYFQMQKQWENEGGATANLIDEDEIPQIRLPMEKGDFFRVLGGVTDFKNGEVIFTADIQKVTKELKTKSD